MHVKYKKSTVECLSKATECHSVSMVWPCLGCKYCFCHQYVIVSFNYVTSHKCPKKQIVIDCDHHWHINGTPKAAHCILFSIKATHRLSLPAEFQRIEGNVVHLESLRIAQSVLLILLGHLLSSFIFRTNSVDVTQLTACICNFHWMILKFLKLREDV